ncbi:MAG: ABC transporter substrate-binding protein [Gemmatimonadaceae bacterium]|jgi:putative spermidine/putrescine transport system substrate-binding protein|nr:ABC transporter substrate-binding protein [Gemmatimonadaceae bacterium]
MAAIAGLALTSVVAGCGAAPVRPAGQAAVDMLAALPWDSVVARARGTTVVWRMWRGDAGINAYVDGWLAPRLRERYGITLQAVEGQGAELVNALVTAREAGARRGTASLLWINGETFAALQDARLLAGPWSHRLPGAALVDSTAPEIVRDFERPTAGYESPWGRVQFALFVDTTRTPRPPGSVRELGAWIRAHPGRFTHDESFTGITFLKTIMYAEGGGVAAFAGGIDEARWARGRDAVFGWLDRHRGAFWRAGRAYPRDVAAMHRLFADGEIDMTMSNNVDEVAAKIAQGVLPSSTRPVLLADGMIRNAHFVGIPGDAPNAAGAMVVADFLLSPEAQYEKRRVDRWGDGTVLAMPRLDSAWRARFAAADAASGLDAATRDAAARPEIDAAYHARLQAEWRRRVRAGTP